MVMRTYFSNQTEQFIKRVNTDIMWDGFPIQQQGFKDEPRVGIVDMRLSDRNNEPNNGGV